MVLESSIIPGAAAAAGPTLATQSDLEAQTEQETYASPDLIHHAASAAKCWIRIADNGTPVTGAHNTATVTPDGTGNRIIVWDIDFADTNYVCAGMTMGNATTVYVRGHTVSVGSFVVQMRNSADDDYRDVGSGHVAFGLGVDE